MKLNNFLNPKFIAVIGASNNVEKVGRKVFDNIVLTKKQGVFPINHKDKNIAGFKAYSDIGELPIKNWAELLVVIVIPASFVLDEIKKCAKLGVKNIVIISAGFKEIGKSGKEMEDNIQEIAIENKMNILGPNCLGFINTQKNLNITFSNYINNNEIVKKDNIAFLSQSGAIGSAILDWLINKNIGLSYFISLGNKAVLNENDFFDFLYKDSKTDLIVVYLEEVSQGRRFLEIVSKISKIKPVAILKSGRTIIGSQMASSHTGSLAGSYETTLVALKRSGAIVLENINEIYNLMRLIKGPVRDVHGDLAIISNAGGPAVLVADECFDKKISLAKISNKTSTKLKKILPEFAHIKNPLDILGDANSERYEKVLNIILADKNVSSALILLTPQSMTKVEEIAEVIGKIKNKYKNKLITTCFLGGVEVGKGKKILAKYLIPNFDSIEEATAILSKFNSYIKNRKKIKIYLNDKKGENLIINNKLLDYIESFKILEKFGIKTAFPKKIVNDNYKKIKYPVVFKFVGPDFVHKTDRQAIFLNVKNQIEAKKIIDSFNKKIKNKTISPNNYIIFQPMLKKSMELILGFKKDPVFGNFILLGLGGIYAEVYKDIVLEVSDLDKNSIMEMIKKLKVYPILAGARGQRGINFNLLIKTILNFIKIINNNKNISEIDINPLFINDKQVVAIDIRIIT